MYISKPFPIRENKQQACGIVSVHSVGIPAANLTHKFTGNEKVPLAFGKAKEMSDACDIKFTEKTGHKFNRYDPADTEIMKPMMLDDSRMAEVFNLLGLPLSEKEKIYLPWWNLEACKENGYSHLFNDVSVTLGSRHSYQTQFLRSGGNIPDMNSVSVAGLVHTSDNKLVLGLRGGLNLPNTYYFCAGALGLTEGLKAGTESIYEFFVNTELHREYGIGAKDLGDAEHLSRVQRYGTDRDISYVFLVKTPLSFEQVENAHRNNQHRDKDEHKALYGLEATKEAILSFVRQYYRGDAENLKDRPDSRIVLLPQGAAPLLVYARVDLRFMEKLASDRLV